MPDEKDVRAAARAEMERQKLSARMLAERTQLNRGTVLDFLHGRRNTHAAVRNVICQELGLVLTTSEQVQA